MCIIISDSDGLFSNKMPGSHKEECEGDTPEKRSLGK